MLMFYMEYHLLLAVPNKLDNKNLTKYQYCIFTSNIYNKEDN